MRTVFCAAVAVAICSGQATALAEDTKPSQRDNLIRRELRVGDPNDPHQIAQGLITKSGSIKKCGQPTGCVQPGTPSTIRPQVRSLLQNSPPY